MLLKIWMFFLHVQIEREIREINYVNNLIWYIIVFPTCMEIQYMFSLFFQPILWGRNIMCIIITINSTLQKRKTNFRKFKWTSLNFRSYRANDWDTSFLTPNTLNFSTTCHFHFNLHWMKLNFVDLKWLVVELRTLCVHSGLFHRYESVLGSWEVWICSQSAYLGSAP